MIASFVLDLTLREILTDIPHDVPALVVYACLAIFGGMIWLGSRSRGGDDPTPPES